MQERGSAPVAPDQPGTIPILRYSTDHLPPEERYKAWLLRDWPRSDPTYRTEPSEPFNTMWESVQLGEVMFVYTEITAMRWERRQQDIRSSDFDPIIVNMMIDGLAQGDMDGRSFYEPSGTLHFHDLGRPSLHVSSASKTYSLVFPRPLAQQLFGPLHDLHGMVVPAASAGMLFALAEATRRALPRLDVMAAERLQRAFVELVAIALAELRPSAEHHIQSEKLFLQRAHEEIDRRLAEGKITTAELCEVLGVTPARLSAAFQAEGGTHRFIARRRLERARVALADIDRAEPIGNIAHRFGFCDSSHLVRLFRASFGMSPREYRNLATLNQTTVVPD